MNDQEWWTTANYIVKRVMDQVGGALSRRLISAIGD
jgi:hypothetical protein